MKCDEHFAIGHENNEYIPGEDLAGHDEAGSVAVYIYYSSGGLNVEGPQMRKSRDVISYHRAGMRPHIKARRSLRGS